MSDLPLHPSLVHVPLGLAVVIPVLTLFIIAAIRFKMFDAKVWIIVPVLQAILILGGFAAMRASDIEKDIVEQIGGTVKTAIHDHEEAADLFVNVGIVSLIFGIAAYVFGKKKLGIFLRLATAIITLLILIQGINTGKLGGELVYKYNAAKPHLPTQSIEYNTQSHIQDTDDD